MATRDTTVRARIPSELKDSAESILKKLGLSNSQAINLFFYQIILHKGLPFPLSLEKEDISKNYTKVKNTSHLKKLIGLG